MRGKAQERQRATHLPSATCHGTAEAEGSSRRIHASQYRWSLLWLSAYLRRHKPASPQSHKSASVVPTSTADQWVC